MGPGTRHILEFIFHRFSGLTLDFLHILLSLFLYIPVN